MIAHSSESMGSYVMIILQLFIAIYLGLHLLSIKALSQTFPIVS